MKNILSNIFLYYYVSYYKFFKNVKQNDKEASENAKGIFCMNMFFLFSIFFFHFFWSDLTFLHQGSNLRFFGMLLLPPLIYLFGKNVKIRDPLPNNISFNWKRCIIVTSTMPLLIFLLFKFGGLR